MEFTHPELGSEIRSISGYYIPREEHTLNYKDREVLYILGQACIDTSCCGSSAWSYVQVPGFLVKRNLREEFPAVSEVEAIADKADRAKVREVLAAMYPGSQVEMW